MQLADLMTSDLTINELAFWLLEQANQSEWHRDNAEHLLRAMADAVEWHQLGDLEALEAAKQARRGPR